MFTFLLAFLVLSSVLLLVMLGTLLNKKPIQGTCGSLKGWSLGINDKMDCEICGSKNPQESCEK